MRTKRGPSEFPGAWRSGAFRTDSPHLAVGHTLSFSNISLRNRSALATKQSADRDSIFTGTNGSQRNLSDPAETVHRHEHLRPTDPRQSAEVFHGLCAIFFEHTEHSSIDRLRSGRRLAVSSHGSLSGNRKASRSEGHTYVLTCKYARVFPACNEFVQFCTKRTMRVSGRTHGGLRISRRGAVRPARLVVRRQEPGMETRDP